MANDEGRKAPDSVRLISGCGTHLTSFQGYALAAVTMASQDDESPGAPVRHDLYLMDMDSAEALVKMLQQTIEEARSLAQPGQ